MDTNEIEWIEIKEGNKTTLRRVPKGSYDPDNYKDPYQGDRTTSGCKYTTLGIDKDTFNHIFKK